MNLDPFAELSAENARLERRVAQLERELREQEANHADRERQVQSWRRMWADIGQQGRSAANGFRSAIVISQSGLYADSATKKDALDALDEILEAARPMLEVTGKLGQPF